MRKLVPALILFLTLAWQSFVIQAHVHPLEAASRAASVRAASRAGIVVAGDSRGDPATCPICQALGQIGHILSPTPPALYLPTGTTVLTAVPILDPWTRRDRSHAWRSRGPPRRS
jgi:hypothetical protein